MRCHHRGAADSSLAFQPSPSSSPRKGRTGCRFARARFSHRALLLPPLRFQDAVLAKGALKVWSWIRRCSLSLRQTTIAATEAVGPPPGPAKIRYVRRDHTRLPSFLACLPVISCMSWPGQPRLGATVYVHPTSPRMAAGPEWNFQSRRQDWSKFFSCACLPHLFLFPCAATLPCDIPWQASLLTLLLLPRLSSFFADSVMAAPQL